jgi:hypothetical protein
MSLMILVGPDYLTVGQTGLELQLDLESKLRELTSLKDTIYLAAGERTTIFGDAKMTTAPFGRQAPWVFRRDNVGSFRLRHRMHSAQTRLAAL